MLEIYERLGMHCHDEVYATVELTHEQRDRGRLKLTSLKGEDVRVFLERGTPLLVDEYLKSQCGKIVQVKGAVEAVALATCEDWQTFSRACYHLGNRHVKLQVGERWLRILPDHVLEGMLVQLGLMVSHTQAIFVPESGAYQKQSHSEGSHSHGGHSHHH